MSRFEVQKMRRSADVALVLQCKCGQIDKLDEVDYGLFGVQSGFLKVC